MTLESVGVRTPGSVLLDRQVRMLRTFEVRSILGILYRRAACPLRQAQKAASLQEAKARIKLLYVWTG